MKKIINFNLVAKVYLYKEEEKKEAVYIEPYNGFKWLGIQILEPHNGYWKLNDRKITLSGNTIYFLKNNKIYEKPCAYVVFTSSTPNEYLRFNSFKEMKVYFENIERSVPGFKILLKDENKSHI